MRIAIATRIFEPEPSAASVRLTALATELASSGHEVTVFTVTTGPGLRTIAAERDARAPFRVRRCPVIRDRTGYVRGYVPYLSFDIPLFFRLLMSRRFDAIICEPPPTTGVMVRLAAGLRRIPYAYYVADIWADASAQTGAPSLVVRVVRGMERFAWRGARVLFSVSQGITKRLRALSFERAVVTVGNGVNTAAYTDALASAPKQLATGAEFVYAGTASEWHGADVFVRALPGVLREVPGARLRFIGGGSQREAMEQLAQELGVAHAVAWEPVMQPAELAPILRAATAAVASVRQGAGYDFAFPTKLYSAATCGVPLIYAGPGPAIEFVRTEFAGVPLGEAVILTPDEVAAAMVRAAKAPYDRARREQITAWAQDALSIDGVAARARAAIEEEIRA